MNFVSYFSRNSEASLFVKRIRILMIVLSLTGGINSVNAQWQQISNGLNGAIATCIAQWNNQILLGTSKVGVFKYDSTSSSWNSMNNGLTAVDCRGFAIDSNHLYLAAGNGIFSFSITSGLWTQLTTSGVLCIAVHDHTIYTGGTNGIMVSGNNGLTWTAMNNGLSSNAVRAFAFVGDTIFAGVNADGVYRSINNGISWTAVGGLIAGHSIFSFTQKGNKIFAGAYGTGVFVSADNGNSWTLSTNGLTSLSVNSLCQAGGKVFAGTFSKGVCYTMNDGLSWSAVDTASGFTDYMIGALYSDNNRLYAGTRGEGVFVSTDYGNTWFISNQGLCNIGINNICFGNNKIIISEYYKGIYVSSNGGLQWSALNNGIEEKRINSLNTEGNVYFAGSNGAGVFKSFNEGIDWFLSNNGLNNLNITHIIKTPGKVHCATLGSGIFTANANGVLWQADNNGITAFNALRSFAKIGPYLFVKGGGIYRREIEKTDWINVNGNLPPITATMALHGLYAYGNLLLAGGGGAEIIKSSDFGASWVITNSGIVNGSLSCFASDSYRLYGGFNKGVYYSLDSGNTWNPMNNGLADLQISSLNCDGSYLYAGTANTGIWRFALSSLGLDKSPVNEYYRVFPNPCHESFELISKTKNTNFLFALYDISGREIANGGSNGSSSVIIDVRNFTPGVYILIIHDQENIRYSKIVKTD